MEFVPDAPVPVSGMTTVPFVVALLIIVNVPLAAPVVVGSNCNCSVIELPGLRFAGKDVPATVNPVPLTAALLMVSAAVPDEVSNTDCVDAVLRLTLPKATLVAPTVSAGAAALNCRPNVLVIPPAAAVSVALCAVVTAEAAAVKAALAEPAGTVTDAGTVTALLLLATLTLRPPVPAGAVRVTEQESLATPVSVPLLQEMPLSVPAAAVPVPLRRTPAVPPAAALLVSVRAPLTVPVAVGANLICSVAVAPGLSVTGKLDPDTLKPEPVTEAALMVSAALPDDVMVRVWSVAVVFRVTVPKLRLVLLRANAGAAASSWRAQVFVEPPAEAVNVAF